jgi:hypothetical protein
MAIIKELEVRRKEGNLVISFKGEFASRMSAQLSIVPQITKKVRSIAKKGEFVVFECIMDCGYTFFDSVELILHKGDYIKIIQ